MFIPQLVRNRFPSRGAGGRTPWHLIPAAAFENAARYKGGETDERRLFYVAVTRAQKFLHMTWAPTKGNSHAQSPSDFFDEVRESKYVKRKRQDYAPRKRLPPHPRASVANVTLSFSDMKYFLECPYQFKLRILYGFNAPLTEALGYGKSVSRRRTREVTEDESLEARPLPHNRDRVAIREPLCGMRASRVCLDLIMIEEDEPVGGSSPGATEVLDLAHRHFDP